MDGEEVMADGREGRDQPGRAERSGRRMVALAVLSLAVAFFLPCFRFSEIQRIFRNNRAIVLSLKDKGRGDPSVSQCFQTIDDRPGAPVPALVAYGRWQLWNNLPGSAVVALRQAVALDPEDRQANFFLGRALTEANLLEEAVDAFRRTGLSNGAGDFNLLTHTAWLNLEAARLSGPRAPEWEKAERYYQVARLLFRDDWRHWRNAADFYLYYRLDEDQGLAFLRQAEDAFPESVLPHLEAARYFAKKSRKAEFVGALRRAVTKKADDPEIYQLAYDVLRGDTTLKGQEWLLLARRHLPPDSEIRGRLEELQRAADPVNRKGPSE